MKIISITNFVRYEVFIFVGLAMAMGTLLKLLHVFEFCLNTIAYSNAV
jgi:hypothetical protein